MDTLHPQTLQTFNVDSVVPIAKLVQVIKGSVQVVLLINTFLTIIILVLILVPLVLL